MLLVGAVVPQLRPNLALGESAENAQDEDVCLTIIARLFYAIKELHLSNIVCT